MYILSQLSWHTKDPKVDPSVEGYYDSTHRWNAIPRIYMDYYQIWGLIGFYLKHPQFNRILSIDHMTETLAMMHNGITRIPSKKIVLHPGRLATIVWPIDFEISYFDVKVAKDNRIFSSVNIQDAIVYGIHKGMDAGRRELDLIDGHTPIDFAILYAQTLDGLSQ